MGIRLLQCLTIMQYSKVGYDSVSLFHEDPILQDKHWMGSPESLRTTGIRQLRT